MSERLAVVAATRVISELPCAAVDTDTQDQARQYGIIPLALYKWGIERAVSFLVGMSGGPGIWVNLGAAGPLYPGIPWGAKGRGTMPIE